MTANGDTIPGAVIVDEYDGHTWHEDEAGRLLTPETAAELAERFNSRPRTGHAARRFRVFTLVPADAGPWRAGGELAALFTAANDEEHAAIEAAAVRAGILLKCAEPECGAGIGSAGDNCQACGEPFSECAICVPGQCPGPDDCPGNYAHEPGSYDAGECTCTRAHDGRGLACAGCPVHDPITTGQEQQQ